MGKCERCSAAIEETSVEAFEVTGKILCEDCWDEHRERWEQFRRDEGADEPYRIMPWEDEIDRRDLNYEDDDDHR